MKSFNLKQFANWFLMADKHSAENFEANYKKSLNVVRIVFIFIIPILLTQCERCNPIREFLQNSQTNHSIFTIIITTAFLLLLFLLYKPWIINLWIFFKTDVIVHYIFLAIIPAAVIFIGYQSLFNGKYTAGNTGLSKTESQENPQKTAQEYDEIIDRLNGFYSSLFTAIAIIAAILALGGWRTVREMKDKLEKFKEIEDKVDFLHTKHQLALWVQDVFDNDDREKKNLLSSSLPIEKPDDRKKYNEIETHLKIEATDDAWLKIIYTKNLLKLIEYLKDDREKKCLFTRIEKLYAFIEAQDLFKENSGLIGILPHLQGQLHWEQYKYLKENEKKSIPSSTPGQKPLYDLTKWYTIPSNSDSHRIPSVLNLKKAIEYYNRAIVSLKDKPKEETYGNLALALIELSRFRRKGDEKTPFKIGDIPEITTNFECDDAQKCLESKKDPDFNTYWDKARYYYYQENTAEEVYKNLLLEAADNVEFKDEKRLFLRFLEQEINENGPWAKKRGFPGNDSIVKEVKDRLMARNLG